MVRTFQASEYQEPAERGLNFPVKLRGRAEDGSEATIFVKTRAGYQNRTGAPGVELFTTLLARTLGLPAPEPVLVQIPPGFERVIHEAPEFRELIRQSPGTNFGTVALGPDWKTWPVAMSTRAFSAELVEDILAFDALAQNTDREWSNPNLLWRDHEIAIVDHDKCFGNLALTQSDPRPWRSFLGSRPLRRHCLWSPPASVTPRFGSRIHKELIGFEFEDPIPALLAEALDPFPDAGLDLDRIGRYFDALKGKTDDFFAYLNLSLQP